jgi:hypothetical protein
MSTAKFDQIIRQEDSHVKAAVRRLARDDVSTALSVLREQGRVNSHDQSS